MPRRNLILLLHEDQMRGVDVVSTSSSIPGGLPIVDTVSFIKSSIYDILSANADYLKYGAHIKEKLSKIRSSTNISFTVYDIADFKLNLNSRFSTKDLPIYENIYIINVSDNLIKVDVGGEAFNSNLMKDSLLVPSGTIMSLERDHNIDNGTTYNIMSRDKF